MAVPVGFQGADFLYTAPKGDEDRCGDLPSYRYDGGVISCWRLDEEELNEIARTGVVWLKIASHTLPPMTLSGTALLLIDGEPSKAEPILIRVPAKET